MFERRWPATNTVAYYLHVDSGAAARLLLTPDAAQGTAGAPVVFKASGNNGTFETQPLVNATRFAGTIRVAMTARFLAKAANLKAVLLVDGEKVTWGWTNPRIYQGLDKQASIKLDTDYKLSLEMMPRDFTVLPGSKIAVRIEGYNSDSSLGDAQQIGLDLAQTTLEMPVVPKASPATVTKLD